LFITCLLSLIVLGSTVAFNALLSLTTLGFYFSYAVVIVVFVIRRFHRTNVLQFGPWRLGKFGLFVNLVAIAYCIFLIVFLPFPTELPVTGQNMNYASPVFLVVMGFAIIYYILWGRKYYVGPEMMRDGVVTSGEDEAGRIDTGFGRKL
jgi:choline transport protein